MRIRNLLTAVVAAGVLTGANLVGVAGANGFPGTEMYYDDNGVLVGEANFGCVPNRAWGVATPNVVVRAGCEFSA
ncbi:hypothetical protein LDO32_18760 [Luteimonas sp. Y-2-2-4F]|nr:DUF6289 family protein [Luteimonas sp. Y-2-2-4F]MCD9033757.1 hypothetical protein [Luteimonas sp. Y-2-2-4F]